MEPDRASVLLRKAADDLSVVVLFHEREIGSDEQLGFHCQQAIEKSIKAVLARRGIDYPWTHDLTRLLLILDTSGIPIPAELREADLYTSFAVRFRYEDLPEQGVSAQPFDRAHARRLATLAVEWALAAV